MKFILASASPRRLALLKQIGYAPDQVISTDLDETPLSRELPKPHAERLALAKAQTTAQKHAGAIILAADTVVACGRRILPKAEEEAQARHCLNLLSGRRHHVYTAVCVIDAKGKAHQVCVDSQVKFQRLEKMQIEQYIQSGQWRGKAGGYAIQGLAASFIPWISGAQANIMGLPLVESRRMLLAAGLQPNSVLEVL